MKSAYLEGGRILTSHGVKGLVKVEHLCDSPKVLLSVKRVFLKDRSGTFCEKKVLSCSVMGQFLLMGMADCFILTARTFLSPRALCL